MALSLSLFWSDGTHERSAAIDRCSVRCCVRLVWWATVFMTKTMMMRHNSYYNVFTSRLNSAGSNAIHFGIDDDQ